MNELCKSAKVSGIGEIVEWLKTNQLDTEQAKELASFMREAPYSQMLGCWKAAQVKIENLMLLHTFVADDLVRRTTSGEADR